MYVAVEGLSSEQKAFDPIVWGIGFAGKPGEAYIPTREQLTEYEEQAECIAGDIGRPIVVYCPGFEMLVWPGVTIVKGKRWWRRMVARDHPAPRA